MLLHLGDHDLLHLLLDALDLGVLGVAGGLYLSAAAGGESHGKDSEQVAVLGLDLHEGLDERVPLLDELADLVAGGAHAVEAGVAVGVLDLLHLKLDISPPHVLVFVQVSKVEGVHSVLQVLGVVP